MVTTGGGGKAGITVEGTERVISILTRIGSGLPSVATSALQNIARSTAAQMQRAAPVDTGFLKSHISYSVSGSTTATVSSDATYSGFVNYGTIYMNAQSFFSDGVEFAKSQMMKMVVDELKKKMM